MKSTGSGVYSVRFPRLYRPTWVEIDLEALRSNLSRFRRKIGKRPEILFVVKADAYGHGAVEAAKAALSSGLVSCLGVSSVEEGAVLREAGVRGPILILGSLYPFESTLAAIRYRLTPTVASLDGARLIREAERRLKPVERRRLPLACHLKIDTGMGRIGVRGASSRAIIDFLKETPGVSLSGVYTHCPRAEDDAAYTRAQLRRFTKIVSALDVPCVHAANSAAALRFPESRFDLVRPGLAVYGLMPGFTPVLSLKSRVVFLKRVPKGAPISYGGVWRAKRASRIATLPVGYGDGVPRALSGAGKRSSVLIAGRRCPIVGSVTMDMLMVDVTGIGSVDIGAEAVLIGRSGSRSIGAGELAAAAGTISYEIVTGLSARVPRVYRR
ncbi:MAG: alanine racemase [Elusimicrobia bacterium]|nr:MAG: alanine racemase [Elusimicrobiota bacterium]